MVYSDLQPSSQWSSEESADMRALNSCTRYIGHDCPTRAKMADKEQQIRTAAGM